MEAQPDLAQLTDAELKDKIRHLVEEEREVSMHRRLLHGRIELLKSEMVARLKGRDEGELSVVRFGDLWTQSQEELLGDAVEVTEGYRTWWSYVHHFVSVPGYVYPYAYGQLLALAVYGRYEEEGEAFVPAYLELLEAGGSRSPEELGQIVGIDLADPGFWDRGLALVERQLDAAEQAARESGRL
jgi:oligoendopeptidase F